MKKLLIIISLMYCFSINSLFASEPANNPEAKQAQLEQLLAPIALYPDSLLTHILIASTYPLEVVEAERWLGYNSSLNNEQLLAKAESMDWDPSVMALLPFPPVLTKMSTELDWTRQLGDAFLLSEQQVLVSIQSLRQKADAAGNLQQMENMDVSREDDNIIIEPRQAEVVYVPYYDTRVVYGAWYWPYYPPIYWPHYSHHYVGHHGPFYWHTGIHLSIGWLFGRFHWGNHHVLVSNHHNHSYYNKHHKKHHRGHSASKGGKVNRWKHKPSHRKGVAYSNSHLKKRYSSSRPSLAQTKTLRSHNRELSSVSNDRFVKSKSDKKFTKASAKANKINRHQEFQQKIRVSNDQAKQGKFQNGYKNEQAAKATNKSRSSKQVVTKPSRDIHQPSNTQYRRKVATENGKGNRMRIDNKGQNRQVVTQQSARNNRSAESKPAVKTRNYSTKSSAMKSYNLSSKPTKTIVARSQSRSQSRGPNRARPAKSKRH